MSHAQALVDDYERYIGQYVTTSDFDSTTVITASESAKEAYQRALNLGVSDPVLIWIPPSGVWFVRFLQKYPLS